LYGAETWTLWKVDQKYLESFEMWSRKRMEKICMKNADCTKNEEVLHRVEERNILPTIKRGKAIWIGYILHGNCLLEHIIEGRVEVMGRRGR
jgi:hypothetical protein